MLLNLLVSELGLTFSLFYVYFELSLGNLGDAISSVLVTGQSPSSVNFGLVRSPRECYLLFSISTLDRVCDTCIPYTSA